MTDVNNLRVLFSTSNPGHLDMGSKALKHNGNVNKRSFSHSIIISIIIK